MENKYYFGDKYIYLKILLPRAAKSLPPKWQYEIYDPIKNRIVVRMDDGNNYWMNLQDYIYIRSWPIAQTGVWPDPYKYATLISSDELAFINAVCQVYRKED